MRKFPGVKPFIVDENGKIRSRAIITKNVIPETSLLFIDKKRSSSINKLSEIIGEEDNLLISIFDPDYFGNLLDETLTPSKDRFIYLNEDGKQNTQPYRGYVLPKPEYQVIREPVREFVSSDVEISHLMFDLSDDNSFMKIDFRTGDTTLERFNP